MSIAVLGSVHCKFSYSYVYESKLRLTLFMADYKRLLFTDNPSLKVLKQFSVSEKNKNVITS